MHRRALKLREGRPLPLGHTAVRRDPVQPKCDSPTDPISPTPTFSKATSKILGLSMHLRQPFQQRPVCVGWLAINGSFLVLHPSSESSTDGYQRQSPAALNAGRRGLSLERNARLSSLPCCSLGREIRKDIPYLPAPSLVRRGNGETPLRLGTSIVYPSPQMDLAYSLGGHRAKL